MSCRIKVNFEAKSKAFFASSYGLMRRLCSGRMNDQNKHDGKSSSIVYIAVAGLKIDFRPRWEEKLFAARKSLDSAGAAMSCLICFRIALICNANISTSQFLRFALRSCKITFRFLIETNKSLELCYSAIFLRDERKFTKLLKKINEPKAININLWWALAAWSTLTKAN